MYYVHPHPAYVIRADRNGVGIVGLVFGVFALLLSLVPLIGVATWFVWPVALALSAAGLQRADTGLATNRGTAAAGLVCALATVLVCAWWSTLALQAVLVTALH